MRETKLENFDPEKIPWPEVNKVSDSGLVEISYALEVNYRPCMSCLEDESGKLRQLSEIDDLTDDFTKSSAYLNLLKQNENIKVSIIPNSVSSEDSYDFSWSIIELRSDGLQISLEFAQPELVSVFGERDIV